MSDKKWSKGKIFDHAAYFGGATVAGAGALGLLLETSNQQGDFKKVQDLSAQVQQMPSDTSDEIAQIKAVQQQISDAAAKGTRDNNWASDCLPGISLGLTIAGSGLASLRQEERRRKKETAKTSAPPTV